MIINGLKASNGIVIGKAYLLNAFTHKLLPNKITNKQKELDKFMDARTQASKDLERIKQDTFDLLGEDYAMIIDAQIEMVNDPSILKSVTEKIDTEYMNAAFSFNEICGYYINLFENMDNEYIKERASDVKDIQVRVLNHLLNQKDTVETFTEDVIVIGHDISPSLMVQFDLNFVKGFAINIGSEYAHNAIIARSLELPGVVGTKDATTKINHGDTLIINGTEGYVIVNPIADEIEEHKEKLVEMNKKKERLVKYTKSNTITKDGFPISLQSNVTTQYELPQLTKYNSEGIGLYRTEYLFMERDSFPSEEEQASIYAKILNYNPNHKVVLRTLDLGGDKQISFLNLKEVKSPLGTRGIRFTLKHKNLFKTQLKAFFKANKGNLHILLPFISSVDEIKQTKDIIEELQPDNKFKLGIMVEIPSVAFGIEEYLPYVDFVSIGTNDLLQYTFAVSRQDSQFNNLANPFSPSFLKLLKNVIEKAAIANVECSVCGELANNPDMALLLLGFGLKEFSMVTSKIPEIRELFQHTNLQKTTLIAQEINNATTIKEVQIVLKKIKAL